MALTKLRKAGLATGPVSTSQIEDGTIQNQEFEDGTLTSVEVVNFLHSNAKLSNSSFTLNGASVNLGGALGTFVDGELVSLANSCNIYKYNYGCRSWLFC